MTRRQSASEIDDEAAAWATRLDGRDLDLIDDPELAGWLDGDRRRRGALLRAQAALSFIDRGRALAGAEEAVRTVRAVRGPSRRALLLGLGAGGAAVAAGLAAAVLRRDEVQRYGTGLGEIRQVPLKDGSRISINTGSDLEVALGARRRGVTLTSGEAWFEVANDADRPFVVAAGKVRVRALGGAFSVRRRGEGCDVLVTEGAVEAWLDGGGRAPTRMPAGCKGVIDDGRDPIVIQEPQEIERTLSWRSGMITLDGQSLAEAAQEFNRYNARQIVITDSSLARRRFVGLFRTNDPEGFAAAVAATIGVRVIDRADVITLARA